MLFIAFVCYYFFYLINRLDLYILFVYFYFAMVFVIYGVTIWSDYYSSFAPEFIGSTELSSSSSNNLLLDDLDLQNQTEFDDERETEIRLKINTYYRFITYTSIITIWVIYYIFSK